MRGKRLLTAAIMAAFVSCGLTFGGLAAPEGSSLTTEQRAEIEKMIKDYLVTNPEVILQSVGEYQAKRQAKAQEDAQQALLKYRDEWGKDASSPVAGNPKGAVTIVEFFDYNCGYCKQVVPSVQEILKTEKDVRYVFKEFPILREDSHTAAKAGLAVWSIDPDKYLAFHVALMGTRGEMTEEKVLKVAETVGVDRKKLIEKMKDPQIEAQINRNLELGRVLNVSGTPAFIVGDKLVPGAVNLQTLRELIANARTAG